MGYPAHSIFLGSEGSRDKRDANVVIPVDHALQLADLAARYLPVKDSRELGAILLARSEEGKFSVALTEPHNGSRKTRLAHLLRVPLASLEPLHISPEQYEEIRDLVYGDTGRQASPRVTGATTTWAQLGSRLGADQAFPGTDDIGLVAEQSDDSVDVAEPRHLLDLAKHILRQAYERNASDIYVESCGGDVGRVRLRIDNLTREHITNIPRDYIRGLLNVYAHLAGIPIDKLHLIPHDATIGMSLRRADGQWLRTEYRCSFVPALNRTADLTIRQNAEPIRDLNKLGFEPYQVRHIIDAASSPRGLILLVGSTGSGKSNTRESILTLLEARRILKIFETGDPPEFHAPERTQIPITAQCDWDAAFKAALRQKPDVITPSEFRDRQQSKCVIDAALTGHLLVTTVHASDIVDALTRLMQFGISPEFQAQALRLVVAQQLVRVLCSRCKVPDTKAQEAGYGEAFTHPEPGMRDVDCVYCAGDGYRGLTAIAEVLAVSPPVQQAIFELAHTSPGQTQEGRGTPAHVMNVAREEARSKGIPFHTLAEAATLKIAAGVTSLREVNRVFNLVEDFDAQWSPNTPSIWGDIGAKSPEGDGDGFIISGEPNNDTNFRSL